MKEFSEGNTWEDRELFHGDYFLANGTGWFHTDKFQIRVIAHDGNCFLEIFDKDGNSLKEVTV